MVKTTSCPFFPSSSATTTYCLPPSRAAFVSHLFSLDDNGLAVIVFRLPSCSSLSYSRRVLSFVSSHFMYDEETEQTSDRSGSISCVEQEER